MEFKILIKKLNNTLSEKEATVFDSWYNESNVHRTYFSRIKDNYSKDLDDIDVEKAWKELSTKLSDRNKKKVYWKYAAAAVVTGILISGYFFKEEIFKDHNQQFSIDSKVVENEIKIGTDKATLTLEDGSVVILGNGQKYTSNTLESTGEYLIYKPSNPETAAIAYNYLTIPRGGQYHIKLSDGTEVWLNSESQLKYPVQFAKGEVRKVELVYGEAYFEVSSSTNHDCTKFKVMANSQEIEVLGTEFNVKAYSDEDEIYTTLLEGSIALHSFNTKTFLKPNEQAILNKKTNSLMVSSHVDVYSEVAWKRGLFSFKDKSLKEIMKVLSRWYDIDVVFEDKSLENVKFKGVISKNQNITDILSLIKNTNYINSYEIKQNTLTLKK